jgi:hypothetical protein
VGCGFVGVVRRQVFSLAFVLAEQGGRLLLDLAGERVIRRAAEPRLGPDVLEDRLLEPDLQIVLVSEREHEEAVVANGRAAAHLPDLRWACPLRVDFGVHHRLRQYRWLSATEFFRMLSDDLRRLVFEMFGRHFVSLLVCYRPKTGPDTGKEKCRNYSGFILTIRGIWHLVTAGHILQRLEKAVNSGEVEITRSYLLDSYGSGRVTNLPNPFDFEDAPKTYLYDDEAGLDFGLILLRPYYQRLLEANKILPFSEVDWVKQPAKFEAMFMLGLPFELNPGEVRLDGITIEPALLRVEQLDGPPDDLPEAKVTAYPRFWGRISAVTGLSDIEGMSGGPIYGQAYDRDGNLRYWAVAIQSGWFRTSGIVAANPVSVMGWIMERYLATLVEEGSPPEREG